MFVSRIWSVNLYSLCFVNFHAFRRPFPPILSSTVLRNDELLYTTILSVISELTCHLLKRHAIYFCSTSSVIIATWRKYPMAVTPHFYSVTLPHTRADYYHMKLASRQSQLDRINLFSRKARGFQAWSKGVCDHYTSTVRKITPGTYRSSLYKSV